MILKRGEGGGAQPQGIYNKAQADGNTQFINNNKIK
jgi:hypothetical protein